jgi:hypothetical protein
MERSAPVASSDEIDLYVRTYYSLLRSTGEVRVRAFEEAHAFSGSSLHPGALSPTPDVSAFAYAAARLPDEMLHTKLVVLGQSHELFEAVGFDVRAWKTARTRGRRRPLRFDADTSTLGVFIASESDIDDFIPILTAYQIEWNKMHERLRTLGKDADFVMPDNAKLAELLTVSEDELGILHEAFTGVRFEQSLRELARRPSDVNVRMLAASYSQYQRAAQRWWGEVEPAYVSPTPPRRGPVYFVSSNTHAIANLVGGYARANTQAILDYARDKDPEGLSEAIERATSDGVEADVLPLVYYFLRGFLHATPGKERIRAVREFEKEVGVVHISEPGHIDVDAQIIELAKVDPELIDPRLRVSGMELLAKSDARIVNIDYPLGMAAYHLLSRLGQGVGELRGVYVMGKAATLNGRVGDVCLSGTVYDEHTQNTFLFRNCFSARDVRPFLKHGSVFDNQSALTVRSAFLQNKHYMNAFYRDGYTVLEMEAGPFLSAIYELVNPTRVPQKEIVHLSASTPFDVGILHYASDTPYSRRQSLLSKSLSYFGVDSTYASAIAIVRRIFDQEVARLSRRGASPQATMPPPA